MIVNMLRDFIDPGSPMEVPAARSIIDNIAGEISYAREKGRPVIYLVDAHEEDEAEFDLWPVHAVKGSQGAQIIDALAPIPGDHVVEKNSYSGFYQTELGSLLDELEIGELLLTGVMTNVAILYTAVGAIMRGIGVVVPQTCSAAMTEQDHLFSLRQINEVLTNPATRRWKKGEE